jgi:hypothetical protein
MRIVQPPRDGVEHPRNTVLSDASSEEGIALECTKGIILDFGVRWRGALTDKIEVYVGLERRRVEKDEPYVYAELRLFPYQVSI